MFRFYLCSFSFPLLSFTCFVCVYFCQCSGLDQSFHYHVVAELVFTSFLSSTWCMCCFCRWFFFYGCPKNWTIASIARCFNDKIRALWNTFIVMRTFILILSQVCIERESILSCTSSSLLMRPYECVYVARYARNTQVHLILSKQKVTTSTKKVLWNLSKIVLAGRWLLILSAMHIADAYTASTTVLWSSLCLLMANMLKTTYS